MKKTVFLYMLIVALSAGAQDITGKWNGLLAVPGMEIRLSFNITRSENGYSATMDSPDQGANDIPVTTTRFENQVLTLQIPAAGLEYKGELKAETIEGTFKQGPQSIPMNLSRRTVAVSARPQEPLKPYPYYSEELTFDNKKAGITLAGTLTLPKKEGKFPVVVLISGSGPQNRDEEMLRHKTFLVLADYLTRNGIAVLRYDDRGTHASKGVFNGATTADFATDTEAAVNYLRTRPEIDRAQIGLIGHSEGGMIAPMVAARNPKNIRFIVLLAGPGTPIPRLLLSQQESISRAAGIDETAIQLARSINSGEYEIILASSDSRQAKERLVAYVKQAAHDHPEALILPPGMSGEQAAELQANQLVEPWLYYFMRYNPEVSLSNVKCPVLAINGSKDLQVPAAENLAAIRTALEKGGNKNVTTKELPGLNHLFQEAETGAPDEYAKIEQTFSPAALTLVTDWILQHVK